MRVAFESVLKTGYLHLQYFGLKYRFYAKFFLIGQLLVFLALDLGPHSKAQPSLYIPTLTEQLLT